jgi:colicin import membrane protein
MSRLQKKCFIASTGVHLLLVVILFVGPGFLARPEKAENVPELSFIPAELVDAPVQNPGERSAGAPRQIPTPPAPAPAPRQVETAKQESNDVKPNHRDAVELSDHTPRLPRVSTELTSRTGPNRSTKKSSSTSDSREQQLADANREARAAVSEALRNLRDGGSGGKVVDVSGVGVGVGPSYASYGAWVRKVFEDAWVKPDDATGREPVTEVTVTVGPDGAIISSRIEKHSGDSQMDASVQRVLDRVSSVGRPFPEGADQKPRTYIIPFRLKNIQLS